MNQNVAKNRGLKQTVELANGYTPILYIHMISITVYSIMTDDSVQVVN